MQESRIMSQEDDFEKKLELRKKYGDLHERFDGLGVKKSRDQLDSFMEDANKLVQTVEGAKGK